jgi:hypothetical protein
MKERDRLEDLGLDGRIMLKLDLQENGGGMRKVDQIHLAQVGSCEHSNEPKSDIDQQMHKKSNV